MAEYEGVLIYGELINGSLAGITTELLGCGRNLADELKESLSCLLTSDTVGEASKEAIAFGADKVYVIEDPLLKEYQPDSHMQVLEKLIKETSPRIVLTGHTPTGADLAPRLAFRLGVASATDCIELSVDPETKFLLATRPVYGGLAQATYTCELRPNVASVRTKTQATLERDDSRKGEIIPQKAEIDASKVRTKIVETVKEEAGEGVKLEDAVVIVSGGRGMGGPEPFKTVLKEVADIFSKGGIPAAVGASRPPADNHWVPEALHIGLTGKIVAPDIYFAIAISGASQHIAGMSGSKTIIAINKDPEANIFNEARFGIVAKYEDSVPALTEKLKELLG